MIKVAFFIISVLFQSYAFAGVDIRSVWDWNHPEKAELAFAKLADEAKSDQDKDFYLQLLTQMARAQGLQEKFDQANATLNQVQLQLTENTLFAKIRYYLERGRVFNSSKQPEQATPLFKTAFDLAMPVSDDLAIDAAHMMGIALSDPDEQVDWDLKALGIVSNSVDLTVKSWIVAIDYNMSWSLYDGKRFEESLEAFTKYVAVLESHGSQPDQEVLDTISDLKKQLGR